MPEYIDNPRQAPRVPVRCDARVAVRDGGFFASPTSDYGPRGCQVLAPARLAPGTRLFVELVNEKVEGAVELAGRVAWIAAAPPWRMGVAFDGGSFAAAAGFFERLAAAYPGVDAYGRAPDRIPADAPLAPASPPPFQPHLSGEEARVLAALGAGGSAAELRARLGPDWEATIYALFGLLGRRHVVLGPPDPAAAAAWRELRPGSAPAEPR
jgi:hypothetical protein